MEIFAGILVDVVVGLVTTILGVFLIFWAFAPRIAFDTHVRTIQRDGKHHYRFRYRNASLLTVYNVDVIAYFLVRGPKRATRVYIPLSTDRYHALPHEKKGRWITPRLLLAEVDWPRYLPSLDHGATDQLDLPTILEKYGAEVKISVSASSAIFGVATAKVGTYTAAQIAEPDARDATPTTEDVQP